MKTYVFDVEFTIRNTIFIDAISQEEADEIIDGQSDAVLFYDYSDTPDYISVDAVNCVGTLPYYSESEE